MDFYSLDNYTYSDLEYLINNEVEENIHLDYKASGALSKEPKKRQEITKDVSAFANSDGGIIIYGISEKAHKPEGFSYIDGKEFTKEWLENEINLIQPRIDGIEIFPIRIDNDLAKSVYIVKIPRSEKAPHMARSNKYYKRFNFMSEPMEDYEVKDVMFRHHSPSLVIIGASLDKQEKDDSYSFFFRCWIQNTGRKISKDYKLSASFFNLPYGISCHYQPAECQVNQTQICNYCLKLSSPSKETIFSGEIIETGHYYLDIPKSRLADFEKVYIKLTLLYEDGKKDEMLTDGKEDSILSILNSKEIDEYIKKDHPDFDMISFV